MHIDPELIEETVIRLMRTAVTTLPSDVLEALERALKEETEEVARSQLSTILENIKLAETGSIPMCQDTGVPIFFVRGPCEVELEHAIRNGVARATAEIPLRPNVVDPLSRSNTGNNIGPGMPSVHFEPGRSGHIEITFMPKGAGSENMSELRMLNPSQGMKGIRSFVMETVVSAEGRPCPPTIIGLGIGGTADQAMLNAKKALIRPLLTVNEDPELDALEKELTAMLNQLGIGPMGLGGRTTVLDVHIEKAACHTASLPVAICVQCWAARRASARIFKDGRVQFSTEGF